MTVMLHDKGLSTDVDWQNKDYSGKSISADTETNSTNEEMAEEVEVSNATERNLAMALLSWTGWLVD